MGRLHDCGKCKEFIPHPHLDRLKDLTSRQKPRFVLIDGHFDWNGVGVRDEWLQAILAKIRGCPQHTFPILSKKPEGFGRFSYPENVMLGATVTNEGKEPFREMTDRPNDIEDWKRIEILRAFEGNRRFISFEPLLGPLPEHVSLSGIDWVIIERRKACSYGPAVA